MAELAIIAGLEAVALVAVVFLFLRHLGTLQAERERVPERIAHLEKQWTQERRELLNRIQRPEHTPVAAPVDFIVPEPEPDEIDLVGTIAEPGLEE